MGLVRKNLFWIALIVLSALPAALIAVSFHHHHHETSEKHDCSLCNWQLTASQSHSAPVPPALFPITWIFLFFLSKPSRCFSFLKTSRSGRSPPKSLL